MESGRKTAFFALMALFAVFLLAGALAQSSDPKITSLKANTSAAREGEAVLFTAVTEAPDGSLYSWEFGDGQKAEGLTFKEAKHPYYLETGTTSKSFTATLTIKAPSGNTASQRATVSVSKASFKAKIIEPSSGQEAPLAKGETFTLKIQFLNKADEVVKFSDMRSLKLSVNGLELEVPKQTSQQGVYQTELPTSFTFSSPLTYLTVSAEAAFSGAQQKISSDLPLYFAPAPLSLSDPFASAFYAEGDSFEDLEMDVLFPDREKDLGARLTAAIRIGEEIQRIPIARVNDRYQLPFQHTVTALDVEKGIEISISGFDDFGNTLAEKTLQAPVRPLSAPLEVVVLNPSFEPGSTFGFLEPLEFAAEITPLAPGITVQSVSLVAVDGENRVVQEMKREEGKEAYSTLFSNPQGTEARKISYFLEIRGTREGKPFLVQYPETPLDAKLSAEVNVDFVYPHAGATELNPALRSRVWVSVLYPDGAPFRKEQLNARLTVDGVAKNVKLRRGDNVYEAELDAPLEGKHSLEIELLGFDFSAEKIKKQIITDITVPWVDLLSKVLIGLGALILLVGLYFLVTKKVLAGKKGLEQYAGTAGSLQDNLKKLEMDYRLGKISTAQYAERLIELKRQSYRLPSEKAVAEKPKGKMERMEEDIQAEIREMDRQFEEAEKGPSPRPPAPVSQAARKQAAPREERVQRPFGQKLRPPMEERTAEESAEKEEEFFIEEITRPTIQPKAAPVPEPAQPPSLPLVSTIDKYRALLEEEKMEQEKRERLESMERRRKEETKQREVSFDLPKEEDLFAQPPSRKPSEPRPQPPAPSVPPSSQPQDDTTQKIQDQVKKWKEMFGDEEDK